MTEKLTGINLFRLDDMIKVLGEEMVKQEHLLPFTCPLNQDVEFFLHNKAIEFSKRDWAKTQLVYLSYKSNPVLVGYFTLTSGKPVIVETKGLSKGLVKRIKPFSRNGIANGKSYINMPLIAQLGKNYTNNYNHLISGEELLQLAIEEIRKTQIIFGGQFVYVECEEEECLMEFYKKNGFIEFGFRERDRYEIQVKSKRLCQLLRKI